MATYRNTTPRRACRRPSWARKWCIDRPSNTLCEVSRTSVAWRRIHMPGGARFLRGSWAFGSASVNCPASYLCTADSSGCVALATRRSTPDWLSTVLAHCLKTFAQWYLFCVCKQGRGWYGSFSGSILVYCCEVAKRNTCFRFSVGDTSYGCIERRLINSHLYQRNVPCTLST